MTKPAEQVYTLSEAAAIKAVSEATLKRAIHATVGNTLSAKKIGRGYRVSASELDRWYDDLPDAT